MKTFFLIGLLGFFALSGNLYASNPVPQCEIQTEQEREAFRQRVQEQRVAFFTERLALTPEEAEKFWALYNTYQQERRALIKEIRRKTRVRQAPGQGFVFDISNLSDAEVQQLVDNRAKQIDLERQFHNDLAQLLSPRRMLAFYDAERVFQRELVNARNRAGESERRNQGEQRRGGRSR